MVNQRRRLLIGWSTNPPLSTRPVMWCKDWRSWNRRWKAVAKNGAFWLQQTVICIMNMLQSKSCTRLTRDQCDSVMPAQLLERNLCTVWSSHVHNVNKRDAQLHTLQSLHSQVVHSRTMRPRERAWRFPSTYRGTVCRAAHWRFPCRQRRKLVGHFFWICI